MLTAEQKRARQKTLGASEIPALFGLDDFKTLASVWVSKVHPECIREEPSTPQQERGHYLEGPIAKMYQRDFGRWVKVWQTQVPHPDYPWLVVTPDYGSSPPGIVGNLGKRVRRGKAITRGLEIKTSGVRFYGPQCPPDYKVQAQTQRLCLPVEGVDVAAMNPHAFAEGRPFYWAVEADPVREAEILKVARDFWEGYVLTKKEPPADASKQYADYCNLRPSEGKVLELTGDEGDPEAQEIFAEILSYKSLSDRASKLQGMKELKLNKLRVLLRKYDLVKGPFGNFYHTKQQDGESIHWENCFRYLASQLKVSEADAMQLVRIHTRVIPGVRKLWPRWKR